MMGEGTEELVEILWYYMVDEGTEGLGEILCVLYG